MKKNNLFIAIMVGGLFFAGCEKGEKEAEVPKSEKPAAVVEKTEEVEKMVGEKADIDADVDAALDRFYKTVDGAREFAKAAKGLLVMPEVKKMAFVVGGEYGEGALRIDGKTVDYYNTVAASFGLQAGVQAKNFIIAFMTDETLDKFRKSKGWEAGVDGNIAFINIGSGGRLDTNTIKDSVVGFVFDVKGLMADVSLKGAKFTKMDK